MSHPTLPTLATTARLISVSVAAPSAVDGALTSVSLGITSGTLTLVRGTRQDGIRTVLYLMAGLLPLEDGVAEVAAFKQTTTHHPPDDPQKSRRRVGLVPTAPASFAYLTVAENVALPARWTDRRTRPTSSRVTSLLNSVGLASSFDVLPRHLSAVGRRQLALAQVLAYDPDLVLVEGDGLDGAAEEPLAAAVADLVVLDGRTIVTSLTTDSLGLVADHTVTLKAGRIVEDRT